MLTLKTAVGIAVRGEDLEFLCLKRSLRGVEIAGRLRLEKYRRLTPGEAGVSYREFLKQMGVSTANAFLALPRAQALVRFLALPAEAENNMAKAVEYQVDSLHPFEEGAVLYDWTLLTTPAKQTGRLQVAVVMVEKKTAEEYMEWLAASGIPAAGFTVSTAAWYAALAGRPRPLILVDRCGGRVELLGLGSDLLISKEAADVPETLERELALLRAEMRVPPDSEVTVEHSGEGAASLAYAAALAALGRTEFRINLLPSDKRVVSSSWTYAPSYALAAIVILLGLATVARGPLQDYLYLRQIDAEIKRLETKVTYVEKLDNHQRRAVNRLVLLGALKGETGVKMQVLAELTRILPPSVWLQEADLREGNLTLQGVADSASGLLGTLGGSPTFRNAEFLSSITKNTEGKDLFRIRVAIAPLSRGAAVPAPAPGGKS